MSRPAWLVAALVLAATFASRPVLAQEMIDPEILEAWGALEPPVNFVPSHAKDERHRSKGCDSLFLDTDNPGDRIELTDGRAYVMNDQGATVGTFWLGQAAADAKAA